MRYTEIVEARRHNKWHERHPGGVALLHLVEGRIFGRIITCTACRKPSDVLEAQSRTLGPHEWVDSRTWVCLPCIEARAAAKHDRKAA